MNLALAESGAQGGGDTAAVHYSHITAKEGNMLRTNFVTGHIFNVTLR